MVGCVIDHNVCRRHRSFRCIHFLGVSRIPAVIISVVTIPTVSVFTACSCRLTSGGSCSLSCHSDFISGCCTIFCFYDNLNNVCPNCKIRISSHRLNRCLFIDRCCTHCNTCHGIINRCRVLCGASLKSRRQCSR